MRLMIIPDIFARFDRHDFPRGALFKQTLYGAIKRRVTQNMADDHLAPQTRRRGTYYFTFLFGVGDRLFEEKIVPRLHAGDGVFGMILVLRGNNHRVRKNPGRKKFPVILKNRTAVTPGSQPPLFRVGIDDGRHTEFFGTESRIFAVNHSSLSVSQNGNILSHILSFQAISPPNTLCACAHISETMDKTRSLKSKAGCADALCIDCKNRR